MTPLIIRNVKTGEVINPPKRPRPRLCHVCHCPATAVEVWPEEQVVIDINARKTTQPSQGRQFFCDDHAGGAA